MKKQAFTLVELVVVITILAILATVGFVSFSGYLAWARDTNRIAQVKSMADALQLYKAKSSLPIPDDKVDVQANWTTIAYQWYIGANVLETIEYTEKGLDPKDKNYFSYYLTKNKKDYQLMTFLEEENEDVLAWVFNKTKAVDNSERIPKVLWKRLGILTDDEKSPIQELSSIISDWYLDIATTTDDYVANFSDTESYIGSGSSLLAKINLNKNYNWAFSPKDILGIYMWFDASDDNFIEVNASDELTAWNDKSWKANHVTSILWNPTLGDKKINWLNTVYFDWDDIVNTTAELQAPYTIIFTVQMEWTQSSRVLTWDWNTLIAFHWWGKHDLYLNWWINNSTTTITTDTELFSFSRSVGDNAYFYNNGENIEIWSGGNNNFWALYLWWRSAWTQSSKVYIQEVLVYDRKLDDYERLNVESYLNAKWWPF